jgi:hypothetical protein
MTVSSELIVSIAGVVLSLLFSYIPGLRTWYAALITETKQLIMLGLLVLVTTAIFVLGCYGILSTGIACDKFGAIALIQMLIVGIVSNQAAYLISPQANDVVIAKQLRDDGEGVG